MDTGTILDEEDYQQRLENRAQAWKLALRSLAEERLPDRITLPRLIRGLAPRANAQYTRTYDRLKFKHDDVEALFAYAQHVLWAACWDGAHWFAQSIRTGVVGDTAYTRARCTAAGYADTEGWSYSAFNLMAEKTFVEDFEAVRLSFGFAEAPSDEDVLYAIELHWLWEASDMNLDRPRLLEALHEASEANSLASALSNWDAAESVLLESLEGGVDTEASRNARRLLAKNAAKARHAPSQAAREEIRAKYATEKANFPNKDAAALEYTKLYPFEFSTIRDWLKGA